VTARLFDPETSHMAAAFPRRTDRDWALIALYTNRDGLTDFELAEKLTAMKGRPIGQTSAGKRRGELRDFGLVRDACRRRPSPTGSLCCVWELTDAGRDAGRALLWEKNR
jgi:hypothetical protein